MPSRRERPDAYTSNGMTSTLPTRGQLRHPPSPQPAAQPAHRLQSGLDVGNLQQIRKLVSRALQQDLQPLRIDLAHAPNVAGEMPFA